jgi:hypothetical protein
MSISDKGIGFAERFIAEVPEEPGVFQLSQYNIATFIGYTETNLRAELTRILSGEDGSCTATATWVKFEVTPADRAESFSKELIDAFREAHGAVPRCNDLSSVQAADPAGNRGEKG